MSKIIPFSRFNTPDTIPVPVGGSTAPVYEEQLIEGHKTLVQVGETNLHEFVQASLPETQIYNILSRFERGDESVLNKTQGVYADVVGMPTNLAEAKASIIKFESMFENLPVEDKAKFHNNVNEFLQAIVTAEAEIPVVNKDVPVVEKDGDDNA